MSDPEKTAPVTFHPSADPVVAFGPFRFDRANGLLQRGDAEVPLPPRVLAVLRLLVERPGKVVSKQALLDGVWNGAFVSETSLTEAMSLLRQALGDDPQSPTYIQTVHRRGYRFVAPVLTTAAGAPRLLEDATPASGERRGFRLPIAYAVAAAAALLMAAAFLAGRARPPAPAPQPAVRFVLPLPAAAADQKQPFYGATLAVSPDGREVAYSLIVEGGRPLLTRRALGDFEPQPVPGGEGGTQPFYSPDGRWLGFLADNKLKKAPLAGGAPLTVATVPGMAGASWSEDGSIVFSPAFLRGLWRVPADGGEPRRLTTPDAQRGEVGHWWPQALPGGGVLFTGWSATVEDARVLFLAPGESAPRTLLRGAANARYLASGHLLWLAPTGLLTAPFDARRGRLTGPPAALREPVRWYTSGLGIFAVGGDTLAYVAGGGESPRRELVLYDRAGARSSVPAPPRFYRNVAGAPGGERAAVTILEGRRSDIWSVDLAGGALTRLTFAGFNIEPAWSSDGRWLVFATRADDGPFQIYRRRADGGAPAERLQESPRHQYPEGFTPDGSALVYTESTPETGFDLWLLRFAGPEPRARPLLRTAASELFAAVSPDGRWLAYSSDESGRFEVYVQAFPGPGGKWQVSAEGGSIPFWSQSGDRLYYLFGDQVMMAAVAGGGEFAFAPPRAFAKVPELAAAWAGGDEVVVLEERSPSTPTRELRVVVGFTPG